MVAHIALFWNVALTFGLCVVLNAKTDNHAILLQLCMHATMSRVMCVCVRVCACVYVCVCERGNVCVCV